MIESIQRGIVLLIRGSLTKEVRRDLTLAALTHGLTPSVVEPGGMLPQVGDVLLHPRPGYHVKYEIVGGKTTFVLRRNVEAPTDSVMSFIGVKPWTGSKKPLTFFEDGARYTHRKWAPDMLRDEPGWGNPESLKGYAERRAKERLEKQRLELERQQREYELKYGKGGRA